MAALYIKEQGAYIKKKDECIVVNKNSEVLLQIPVAEISNLAIMGNVQLSTQALRLLIGNGVDISYFSLSGKYLGCTKAESSNNIYLRLEQYKIYCDKKRELEFAKIIVNNKILNQENLIKGYSFKKRSYDWKGNVEKIEKYRFQLTESESAYEILGLEGVCSNIYFSAFKNMLKCDFEFPGRQRRPPGDPINALLSLGYSFLSKEVSGALDAESFELYLGILHGVQYGRKSLALDMIEEFRQPVIDRFVIRLLNKRMFTSYDFSFAENEVTLEDEGMKKFCKAYEDWMEDKKFAGGDRNFRTHIKKQAVNLKKSLLEHEKYIPYYWEGPTCI